mmetsp:Transcript_30829/g.105981  ORF Transcript_30829/g.105981 Transcript_30829/m.105981 type:complete len:595 (+) Transcript_30829:323-2107(+)
MIWIFGSRERSCGMISMMFEARSRILSCDISAILSGIWSIRFAAARSVSSLGQPQIVSGSLRRRLCEQSNLTSSFKPPMVSGRNSMALWLRSKSVTLRKRPTWPGTLPFKALCRKDKVCASVRAPSSTGRDSSAPPDKSNFSSRLMRPISAGSLAKRLRFSLNSQTDRSEPTAESTVAMALSLASMNAALRQPARKGPSATISFSRRIKTSHSQSATVESGIAERQFTETSRTLSRMHWPRLSGSLWSRLSWTSSLVSETRWSGSSSGSSKRRFPRRRKSRRPTKRTAPAQRRSRRLCPRLSCSSFCKDSISAGKLSRRLLLRSKVHKVPPSSPMLFGRVTKALLSSLRISNLSILPSSSSGSLLRRLEERRRYRAATSHIMKPDSGSSSRRLSPRSTQTRSDNASCAAWPLQSWSGKERRSSMVRSNLSKRARRTCMTRSFSFVEDRNFKAAVSRRFNEARSMASLFFRTFSCDRCRFRSACSPTRRAFLALLRSFVSTLDPSPILSFAACRARCLASRCSRAETRTWSILSRVAWKASFSACSSASQSLERALRFSAAAAWFAGGSQRSKMGALRTRWNRFFNSEFTSTSLV